MRRRTDYIAVVATSPSTAALLLAWLPWSRDERACCKWPRVCPGEGTAESRTVETVQLCRPACAVYSKCAKMPDRVLAFDSKAEAGEMTRFVSWNRNCDGVASGRCISLSLSNVSFCSFSVSHWEARERERRVVGCPRCYSCVAAQVLVCWTCALLRARLPGPATERV